MSFNQFQPNQTYVGAQHTGDFFSFGNQPNPFATTSQPGFQPFQPTANPFATNVNPHTTSQPGFQPGANPFATNVQQPAQVNPFATTMVTSQPGSKPNPFATTVPQANSLNTNSMEKREWFEKKIAELEATYKELLEVFRKEQEENNRLRQQVQSKDGGLAAAHAELEQKLKEQQEQFLAANKHIRTHLENTRAQYEAEKKKLISDQIAFAKNSVNQYLFRFDDGNFPGNMAANGEDVTKAIGHVRDAYGQLLQAIEEGGDVVGASRRLAERMQKLLEDTKGLANRVDDPELKVQLMEGTRNLTRLAGKLLTDGQEMIGRRPNAQELAEMRSRQSNFNHTGEAMKNAIAQSGKKGMENLDSLAETELRNASRVIAEAAESLKRQAAAQKAAEEERIRQQLALGFDINEIKKKGSNLGDIALGVTAAAQQLMEAAAEAQQERVQRGLESSNNKQSSYHVDPIWAEGLISAAKAVAGSMKVLVGSANNALAGTVDEGALVACCRAVAAHTGKLQISSKVKADRDSVAQPKVDKAAKLVKDTTNDLLNETKRVAEFEEVDIGIKIKDTEVGNIRAEMELEGVVSRFRADVDKANQTLYDLRRKMYGDSNKEAEQQHLKRAASSQVPVNRALGSVISGKDKPTSAHVDTTPIVSPFGKSSASSVPTPSPSFANMQATAEMEDELLPKYMQNKMVIKEDGSKFQKALDSKPQLTVAPRPLHLQHDLNQNAPTGPFGNANSNPMPPPTQTAPTNSFTFGNNDNPFLTPQNSQSTFDTSNPFLSPPSQTFTPSANPFL